MFQPRYWVLVPLIIVPAALRWSGLPWNIVPIGALALFVGVQFRQKSLAFLVPLCAMFLADVGLGVIHAFADNKSMAESLQFYTFHVTAPFVYGSYALIVCLGFCIRRFWNKLEEHRDPHAAPPSAGSRVTTVAVPVAAMSLVGAILFFLITNYGDWLLMNAYPHTLEGLMQCYAAGLPFFRNTVTGDVAGALLLFGGYAAAKDHLSVLERSGLLYTR